MVMMPSTAVSTIALSRTAASRTASSASFRWVMSRAILVKPLSLLSSSKIGASTPLAKNRLPSLRMCQRSSVARPLGGGGCDLVLGHPGGPVLGGEENGELLPQDLSSSG